MKYLVILVNFDSYENNFYSALTKKLIGYADTKELAEDYIRNNAPSTNYEGWDKKVYPYYEIQEVKNINQ